ncbi:MAG: S-methyl-5-thioribose-1-phosphate isomerase [Actinobacteria bacterium]|jgi:methylthioribose-1-phosphate isomerase|nr:S-methyl-5-thioribose-1-phosphate isomerase [Actinomycetota bacterium]NCX16576.1 S-methyl-5-thioribose-1-phosphate isomerase [Actinomycetota bacterium]NCX52903.1 S-methyl-5-thioribose-1-phosphate isomerase [Actinomycetota bacterium]
MRTIAWSDDNGGAITLIDQTLLPGKETALQITHHNQLIDAIKRLAVRGAPALGVAGALGVALIIKEAEAGVVSPGEVSIAIENLRNSRPTAVNLAWGVDQVLPFVPAGFASVLEHALELSRRDGEANRAMGRNGADFLISLTGANTQKKMRILTHCNTGALATTDWGTALGVVRELHNRNLVEEVYADETRPLLQGSRLTAWELHKLKINYRILPDGAAASALFSGLIDAVLIGADRIARNGDTANKIGSLAVALAASQAGIPFLVVAPESTIDREIASGSEIEIEFRDDREVTTLAGVSIAPEGSKAYNPAFDVTPHRYITAIVTEKKVYQPSQGDEL